MSDATKPAANVEKVLNAVIEQAALCGPFDPLKLLPSGLDPDLRSKVLRRLGRVVDEVPVAGLPCWTLKPDERRRVLSGLTNARAALRIMARTTPAIDDPFARELQSALTGHDKKLLPRENRDDAYAARNFAMSAPYATERKSADPRALRRLIASEQAEARRRVVLPHGLYGRDEVRDSIGAFLRSTDAHQGALLVTGVGGIGKSALIAAVVADALKAKTAPAVIVLDFDRPNLFGGDRIEIAREITRQWGRQWPETEQRLSEARAAFPNVSPETDSTAYLTQLNLVLGKLRSALTPGPVAPVAIFLDTFEEVMVRGPAAVTDLLDWLQTLRSQGGLSQMAVVVSGRSAPVLEKAEFDRRFARHVDLPGLSPAAGGKLLREDAAGRKLFTPARARLASAALKGHPQALRLLKRYGAEHPDDIDGIIKDGLDDPNFGVQFAQVFLYTRILGRIRDDEVKKLAHPGLVLRRVTPGLIAAVLAGPCGFKSVDETVAKQLFQKLAATVWIVDQTDRDDVVTHRRELRRLMLPAMNNPDPKDPKKVDLGEKAKAIHLAAADWYGTRRDTTLSPELQELEAFYHRASIFPDAVELAELELRVGALGEDIADLPPRVQAMAKFIQGRGASMREREMAFLPDELRNQLGRSTEATALRRGDTGAVKRRVTRAKPPREEEPAPEFADVLNRDFRDTGHQKPADPNRPIPQTFAEAETLYGNEIHALWAEGDFAGVVAVADRAFGALWDNRTRENWIESRADPVYSAVWKSLLARSVTGIWPEVLKGSESGSHLMTIYVDVWGNYTSLSSGNNPFKLNLAAIALAGRDQPGPAGGLNLLVQTMNLFADARKVLALGMFALRLRRLVRTPAADVPNPPRQTLEVFAAPLRLLTPPYARLARDSLSDRSRLANGAFSFNSPPDLAKLDGIRSAIHGSNPSRLAGELLEQWLVTFGTGQVEMPVDAPATTDRSPDPRFLLRLNEIFDPIANALSPLAASDEGLLQLLGVCQKAALWPDELTPDGFVSPAPADRPLFLAQLVDIADQADLLPELMGIACAMAPQDARLARVALLVDRVEEIFNHRPLPQITATAKGLPS